MAQFVQIAVAPYLEDQTDHVVYALDSDGLVWRLIDGGRDDGWYPLTRKRRDP